MQAPVMSAYDELKLNQALDFKANPDRKIRIDPQGVPHILTGTDGTVDAPFSMLQSQLSVFVVAKFKPLTSQDGAYFMRAIGKNNEIKTAKEWAEFFSSQTLDDVKAAIAPIKQQEANSRSIKKWVKVGLAAAALGFTAKCGYDKVTGEKQTPPASGHVR